MILFSACSRQENKDIHSSDSEKFNPKAIELNNKAVELMQRFQNDSALILFDKAIEFDKTYYLPHSNKIGILISKKQFDKALYESDMVIKKKPDLAEGWTFAGMLHEKQGDTITAINYYKESIKIFDERIKNPKKRNDLAANRLNRAFSLILLGQETEGKGEMRKLKAENPNDLMIDGFLKISKQDYMRQMLGNE